MSEHVMRGGTWKLRLDGPMANLIMTRPEVLNCADCAWMDDLHEALDIIEAADEVRAVIIAGEGSSFSTGIDLRSLSVGKIKIEWFRNWERAMRRIELLEPITVARMQGYAIGGGLQVGLVCDLRVAAEDCQMGLPAVLEALIPGLGAFRLPRFIGVGRARRMILTGELIAAREALAIGLVDWVFPNAEIEQMTTDVVEKLFAGSKTAQHFSKLLTNMAFDKDVGFVSEVYYDYQSRTIATPEHEAAMEIYRQTKGLTVS